MRPSAGLPELSTEIKQGARGFQRDLLPVPEAGRAPWSPFPAPARRSQDRCGEAQLRAVQDGRDDAGFQRGCSCTRSAELPRAPFAELRSGDSDQRRALRSSRRGHALLNAAASSGGSRAPLGAMTPFQGIRPRAVCDSSLPAGDRTHLWHTRQAPPPSSSR